MKKITISYKAFYMKISVYDIYHYLTKMEQNHSKKLKNKTSFCRHHLLKIKPGICP